MAVAPFDTPLQALQVVVPRSASLTLVPEGSASPIVTVTSQPTPEQMGIWWQSMQTEDLSLAYADGFPESPESFCRDIQHGSRQVFLGLCNNQVAGLYWLHDILRRSPGSPLAAWTGAYFLPAYRGRAAIQIWQAARTIWESHGLAHFFVATHIANRHSQAFITRGMRFHRVGVYPQFTYFQGCLTDVVVYCGNPDDRALAWQCAQKRAASLLAATA